MEYWKASNCTLLPSASFHWKASFSRAEAAFSFCFPLNVELVQLSGITRTSLEKLAIRNYTCEYSDFIKGGFVYSPNRKETLNLNLCIHTPRTRGFWGATAVPSTDKWDVVSSLGGWQWGKEGWEKTEVPASYFFFFLEAPSCYEGGHASDQFIISICILFLSFEETLCNLENSWWCSVFIGAQCCTPRLLCCWKQGLLTAASGSAAGAVAKY